MSLSNSEDRPFLPGNMQVICAVGQTDSMTYHGGSRHATVVKFYGPSTGSSITETDTQTISLRMNTTIPAQYTTYMCQSFALPTVADGSIIRVTVCLF